MNDGRCAGTAWSLGHSSLRLGIWPWALPHPLPYQLRWSSRSLRPLTVIRPTRRHAAAAWESLCHTHAPATDRTATCYRLVFTQAFSNEHPTFFFLFMCSILIRPRLPQPLFESGLVGLSFSLIKLFFLHCNRKNNVIDFFKVTIKYIAYNSLYNL